MNIDNKQTFESESVVQYYGARTGLYESEKTILEEYKDKLKNMKMLDIGVGAGRTTKHFASIAKEYLGFDYAENMVKYCRKVFPELRFETLDVRNMGCFTDNSFDFILFSFNGLDVIDHEDRLDVLRQIYRICSSGGSFCFSSHNIQNVPKLFKLRPSFNPFISMRRLYKFLKLRRLNKSLTEIMDNPYALVIDGNHEYCLMNYYIYPIEQIRMLTEIGFTNIRTFSFSNGCEIIDPNRLASETDFAIYYLCSKP
jgi:ubiquinone/menaquinone biosynthesis C-methylase UbiE